MQQGLLSRRLRADKPGDIPRDPDTAEHALEELQGLDDEDTAPVWA
jgi:hypothetical protein